MGFCFRHLFLEGGGAGFSESKARTVNTCRSSFCSFLNGFGWTTERFSAFNSIGVGFRDFLLYMAFMDWFIVGFGDRAEYSVLPGISTLACVLHGFGAMGAER